MGGGECVVSKECRRGVCWSGNVSRSDRALVLACEFLHKVILSVNNSAQFSSRMRQMKDSHILMFLEVLGGPEQSPMLLSPMH